MRAQHSEHTFSRQISTQKRGQRTGGARHPEWWKILEEATLPPERPLTMLNNRHGQSSQVNKCGVFAVRRACEREIFVADAFALMCCQVCGEGDPAQPRFHATSHSVSSVCPAFRSQIENRQRILWASAMGVVVTRATSGHRSGARRGKRALKHMTPLHRNHPSYYRLSTLIERPRKPDIRRSLRTGCEGLLTNSLLDYFERPAYSHPWYS
jgi:hypothetical protein